MALPTLTIHQHNFLTSTTMPKKVTLLDFVERSRLIHGDKYDYSMAEYVNNRTKICIICPIHGEFWQKPYNHLQGKGCPECSRENIINKKRMSYSDFINRSNFVHNNKYNYNKVDYINCFTKVRITCPIHGDFLQSPAAHLRGQGCYKCGIENNKNKIYGLGINDLDDIVIGENRKVYTTWRQMLCRCYDKAYKDKYPTYNGCIVAKEWHKLSVFNKCLDENYIEACCLDKDIILENNKIYSNKTCCFVPNEINALFKNNMFENNIHFDKSSMKYISSISIKGKYLKIGRYKDEHTAKNIYAYFKARYIKSICIFHFKKGNISEETKNHIMNRVNPYINSEFSKNQDIKILSLKFIELIQRRRRLINSNY